MQKIHSRNYLLNLLTIILAFNYLDRLALGIVLQDIKIDLQLNDTQLGLITGLAFAVFYSCMGIPIARWADRGNRVLIISVTTTVWSAAVALCALASSFLQLLIIRIAVAVGEAGCIPPAHSLIGDHFTRGERPRALARYMLGVPVSLAVGYFAAGWLNELYGWRATFVLLGLPGLVLAVLVWLTLPEPRMSSTLKQEMPGGGSIEMHESAANIGFNEVCRVLWKNRTFRHLLMCFAVWYFFGYGLLQWTPAFFIRSHGMATGELGTWFALVYGIGGSLGVYLGGELAARHATNNERLQLIFCGIAFVVFAIVNLLAYLSSTPTVAIAFLAVGAFGGNMAQGPILATIQTLIPPRMRAFSIALVYLFANLIGMGLGPLAAGALSDLLRPVLADESLRYALMILSPGYLWAAWHVWYASRTVSCDIQIEAEGAVADGGHGAAVAN